jgi:hypothetical protein
MIFDTTIIIEECPVPYSERTEIDKKLYREYLIKDMCSCFERHIRSEFNDVPNEEELRDQQFVVFLR